MAGMDLKARSADAVAALAAPDGAAVAVHVLGIHAVIRLALLAERPDDQMVLVLVVPVASLQAPVAPTR